MNSQITNYFNVFVPVKTILLLLLAGLFISAQTPENALAPKADPNYRIGVGDVLSVLVPKNQILSTDTVRVGNNGSIRLPMLDDEIPAKCMTEAELAADITERYKKYMHSPQVYVTVREFNSNPVAVVGAVNAPGRFQLQRPIRLLELVTYVNGVTPNAGRTVQIVRSPHFQSCAAFPVENQTEEEVINIPLAKLMNGDESANPYIFAGDIIKVTDAEQAYIVGNVRSAAAISLNEPVTLSKAIAMAGGVTNEAETKKIKILRQESGSLDKTELIVNLKDINNQKAKDVLLQPNDIVEVPGPSGTKKFFRDLFRTVVPILTTRSIPVLIP